MKVNGIEYIIENVNGNKNYYKVVNNKRVMLTSLELQQLLKDLQRMQEVEKYKQDIINKINNNELKSMTEVEKYIDWLGVKEYKEKLITDIREYLTINQIKRSILEQIKSKQITNKEELQKYLEQYGLTENLKELLKFGEEELDRFNLGLTPVEEFRNFLKEEYNKALQMGEMFKVDFKRKGGINNKYFEVSIKTERDGQIIEYPKNYYVKFDEETTEKLINPVLSEISIKGIVDNNYVKDPTDVINNRYNYRLQNNKNAAVTVSNIEEFYANSLKQQASIIEKEYGINNNEEVSNEIEKESNLELYNKELEKEFSEDEIKQMQEQQMTPDEYRKMYKSGPLLVRTKNDNKGFSIAMPIFIISEFFATLFILLQIILT